MTRKEKLQKLQENIGGEEVAKKIGKALSYMNSLSTKELKKVLNDQIEKGHYENCSLIKMILDKKTIKI